MEGKKVVVALGGAKGVGKTSLALMLKKKHPEIRVFNCGKILRDLSCRRFNKEFKRLNINDRNILREECGEEIIKNFSCVNIIDLHFGEPENGKYQSVIPRSLLDKITHFVMLSADAHKILERRRRDKKNRKLDIKNIINNSMGEKKIVEMLSKKTGIEFISVDNSIGNKSVLEQVELFTDVGKLAGKEEHRNFCRKINDEELKKSYKKGDVVVHAMLNHLWIEPTNVCNARCPLCPTGTGELRRKKEMMKMGDFKRIIDQTSPFVSSINFWNLGEPFLNKDIFKMIKYANSKNILTRVSTNGYVFYDLKNIERLINCGLDNLVVSIDGTTQDIFEKYRVGMDLKKIMKGLVLLSRRKNEKEAKINIVWQYIAMKHNQHQIDGARKNAEKLGMIFDLKSVNMQMLDKKIDYGKYLPDSVSLSRYGKYGKRKYLLKTGDNNKCPELWRSLLINADGKVFPCCYDYKSELFLGDIKKQSIKDIWNGKEMLKVRKLILKDRYHFAPCKKCSIGIKLSVSKNDKKEK